MATLLDIPDLIQNYKDDGEVHGFYRAYLERKARELAKNKRWEKLLDVLALLIYGLILFPNLEGFIDDDSITVFWATRILDEDYVLALLGGVYYTLEVRYIKNRGLILCCIPLLYQWLMVQISSKSSPIKAIDKDGWYQKVIPLTKKSICWYTLNMGKDEVITNYGSFPN